MKAFVMARSKRSERSSSAYLTRALQQEGIDAYRVTPRATPARRIEDAQVIFNHGVSRIPNWIPRVPSSTVWFNEPMTVLLSANKLMMTDTFEYYGIPHLVSTTSKFEAESWRDAGIKVVVRGTLTGCAGAGIRIIQGTQEMPDAPMYTKLFEGEGVREYRVFIAGDDVCDIVEKRRRGRDWCEQHGVDRDSLETNVIRTWHNGWVFARNTFDATPSEREDILACALRAAKSINMRMGGVDMIVDRRNGELNRVFAVETNTSLGLDEDSTSTRVFARALAEAARKLTQEKPE
jgi:hypothetical protein